MYDVLVIGAGVVGSLIARKLSSYSLNFLVIEKENDVGNVSSMANSAIVHSGYDPKVGSLKAKFNVLGNALYPKLCEELDVSFGQIGSLTLAFDEDELAKLKQLALNGEENGVKTQILSQEETLKLEPNISSDVKGSLLAPSAGIVNPFTLTVHAMENALDNGGHLILDEEVIAIKKESDFYCVKTNKNEYQTKIVINAAGLYADKIHAMVEDIDYHITPRKGEYYVLDHFNSGFLKHTIFPVPTSKGKGILITPTTSGNFLVGPSSEFIDDKDDLTTDKLTLDEVRKSASKMIQNIPFNQIIRIYAGNRATPSNHDFNIGYAKSDKHFINVSGIESPGLASSPAIANYVVDELLSKIIDLKKNPNFNPCVRKRIHLKALSNEEKNALIKQNPDYGRIVCNCEQISLGEIKDELNRSVPLNSVKAMKKRTRAGFGKCQGGFCQSIIIRLLADYYKKDMSEILYDKNDSYICRYKNKSEAK